MIDFSSNTGAQKMLSSFFKRSSGKNTCLKFCDDESSALAKSTNCGADVLAALVDLRVERRLAVPAVKLASGLLPEPPRAQGPPLVIRFLRLTL